MNYSFLNFFVLLAAGLATLVVFGSSPGVEGKDSSEEKSHIDQCDKYCGVKGGKSRP